MSCLGFFAGSSPLHRTDPLARLLAAAGLTVTVALCGRLLTLGWALGLGGLLALLAHLDPRRLGRRLAHLNLFMLVLWAVLPWSAPGRPVATLLGLDLSGAGFRLALEITLKGNAIALIFTALVATIDPLRLGVALGRLGLPDKLVHLFTLTLRYTDTIHDEYARLRRAMRARAFRPAFSLHTLRVIGYLVGMLLVRGMERAERVLAAMRCRGFDGRFRSLQPDALAATDLAFVLAAALQAGVWGWLELS